MTVVRLCLGLLVLIGDSMKCESVTIDMIGGTVEIISVGSY